MHNDISDVQIDKSFKVLHSKLQYYKEGTSEFIKTAEVNYDELSDLPSTAFAWPEMRKFAMHNKEHTALSMIYANGEDLPGHVTEKLEKAASMFGIELETKPLEKVASEEAPIVSDDYLLPEKKMCKIASAEEIDLGIDFLKRNARSLDVMSTAHANKVLCKKASEFKKDLPIEVYKEAGLTICNLEKLAEWLETRALVAKEDSHKEAYTKLAHVLSPNTKEAISRDDLLKVATTIAIVDVESGLDNDYHTKLATPMSSVFNTEKIAEETVYFGGVNIPSSSFARLNEDVYAKVLGDDVIEEISTDGAIDHNKVMDIMQTLPADLQQALLPYLQQA